MVNTGMVWLRTKPSLTFTERAGSPILVENQWSYKRGRLDLGFFLTVRLLFLTKLIGWMDKV